MNYNGIKWLKKFIPFFIKFSEKEADIFVIDNGSTDQSIEFLKKNHSEVCIVPLLKNLGFAGGYNEGLKKINSKYFILVNSDIEVTNSWIPPMIKILRNNTNIVAVQPKILSFNNKNKFEYAGAAGGFIDAFGFTFCKGRIFDNTEIDEGQYNQDKEIFWASGACIAIKAEEFKKIGGFDEDFFAHMEEVDLCWRFKNQGKNIFFTSESTVFHVGGGTLNYNSPQKLFLNYRNNLWLIHKNYNSNYPLFTFIFTRIILDQISAFKFLLSGSLSSFLAVEKAHLNYFKAIGSLQTKRKKINKRHINTLSGYCNKSIIWSYFIKGKSKFSEII